MIDLRKDNDTIYIILPETATIMQVEEDTAAIALSIAEEGKAKCMTLDLSAVAQIDSAYLQLLLSLLRESAPGNAVIKGQSQAIDDILDLYGLSLPLPA